MEIIWHGHACFTLKGDNTTVVIDPYGDKIGLKLPKLKGDIVVSTHEHENHNNLTALEGDPRIINWPGEYEVGGVAIETIEAFHYSNSASDKEKELGKINIVTFDIDEMRVCHLSDLGHRLTSELADKIGMIDILLVPVGGYNTIDAKKAHSVVESIEPKLVIPMHYAIEGHKFSELAGVGDFLKEIGKPELKAEDSLKIKKTDLPVENTDFVLLNPQLG